MPYCRSPPDCKASEASSNPGRPAKPPDASRPAGRPTAAVACRAWRCARRPRRLGSPRPESRTCCVDVERVVEVGLAETLAAQRPFPSASIFAGLVGPHVQARRPQAQVEDGVLQRLLLVQAVWGDFRKFLSVVQLVAGRGCTSQAPQRTWAPAVTRWSPDCWVPPAPINPAVL